MFRRKTLSLPVIFAVASSCFSTVDAEVEFELSSQKSYRQGKDGIKFLGGSFAIDLSDGNAVIFSGCDTAFYYPPGDAGQCAVGSSGFFSIGSLNGASLQRPYLAVSQIIPATAFEPREQGAVRLNAAPASGLPRPSGGFKDDSFSVLYNLHTTDIKEYSVTRYFMSRGYTSRERSRFEDEIVPGSYYYSFPRLGAPERPAPINATIFPMIEAKDKLNNQERGFEFVGAGTNRWTQGFIELSFLRPNEIRWTGLSPTVVFGRVDQLFFSIRPIRNTDNPDSEVVRFNNDGPVSIFPSFQNGADPRILLPTPFTTSFTLPPIFRGGTRGIVELEMQRNFRTSGVTYDFSNRKFQIPIVVVNRYSEFREIVFDGENSNNVSILKDKDNDGVNNLNEWILDSDANDASELPIPPFAATGENIDPITGFPDLFEPTFFGFNVDIKKETVPAVVYILQRSKDNGKTWEVFKTDGDWRVETVTTAPTASIPGGRQIQVRSKVLDDLTPVQPEGTENDIYRVKIVLRGNS